MSDVVSSSFPHRARRLGRVFLAGFLLLALITLALGVIYLRNNRAISLNIPTPTLPADNAYDDFVRAGKMARGMKHLTPSNRPDILKHKPTLADYKASAQDFAPALAVVHNALGKPCLTPPVRTIISPFWQNHTLFRNVARNISGAGRYEQLAGRPFDAANIWLDGVEMSAMIAHGGAITDGLTAYAIQSLCLFHFEELLPHLTATELRSIGERMRRIQDKQVSCADALLEDGYASVAGVADSLRQSRLARHETPLEVARSLIQSDSDKMPTREEAGQIAQFVFGSKEQMLEQTLSYYRAVAQEARQLYVGKSRIAVPNNVFGRILVPDVNLMRESFLRHEAIYMVIRVEVALYQYRAESGSFPPALGALVPTYLPAVPDDPFGGARNAPLRYKLTPDGTGFVLYSIGPNMKDDRGNSKVQNSANAEDDIAAGHLFPKSL